MDSYRDFNISNTAYVNMSSHENLFCAATTTTRNQKQKGRPTIYPEQTDFNPKQLGRPTIYPEQTGIKNNYGFI